MSEIRVTTLKDTSGSNSSTTAQIASGRAKAFVNFNGISTVAIRANFNVNSITDRGAGEYTVNFTTALSDANYCVTVGSQNFATNTNTANNFHQNVEATTSSFGIQHVENSVAADCGFIMVSVHR